MQICCEAGWGGGEGQGWLGQTSRPRTGNASAAHLLLHLLLCKFHRLTGLLLSLPKGCQRSSQRTLKALTFSPASFILFLISNMDVDVDVCLPLPLPLPDDVASWLSLSLSLSSLSLFFSRPCRIPRIYRYCFAALQRRTRRSVILLVVGALCASCHCPCHRPRPKPCIVLATSCPLSLIVIGSLLFLKACGLR